MTSSTLLRSDSLPGTAAMGSLAERLQGADAGVAFYSVRHRVTVISKTGTGAWPVARARLGR